MHTTTKHSSLGGALYLRTARSSDKPTIEQENACLAKASLEGVVVDHANVYRDEDTAGRLTLHKRPAFGELLTEARRPGRTFNTLIVDDPSRFARSIAEVLHTFSLFSELGIAIMVASPETDGTSR